jgi:hypothetical protein
MITWVVFLRMFWNFISSLPVKRGGSLSFLVGTISNVLVMEIGWKSESNVTADRKFTSCCIIICVQIMGTIYHYFHWTVHEMGHSAHLKGESHSNTKSWILFTHYNQDNLQTIYYPVFYSHRITRVINELCLYIFT